MDSLNEKYVHQGMVMVVLMRVIMTMMMTVRIRAADVNFGPLCYINLTMENKVTFVKL